MSSDRKARIQALLKSIETGDESGIAVVSTEQYIQHNPQTAEGGPGLAVLFKQLAKTSPRVNIVRIFSDGDFVFAHTEYEFSSSRVGFEVFRFEGELTVEHWDNIQSRKGPNRSGHSMVDGETRVSDLASTEQNRDRVAAFVEEVLIGTDLKALADYVNENDYTEHNPRSGDGIAALAETLFAQKDELKVEYRKLHRLLAEGNFVLSVCEGFLGGVHTSFYDLFRLSRGRIVEHWDTTEKIPPREQWKNDNGKF